MTRQYADIAGRRLAWLQAGQGEPIVLLHAFPLNADMWQPQLDDVPHGWRLIAPDLRNFGESSGPPAVSMDDHAEDVLALMRHLNIERAVIGGLSMGGYITFALYRRAAQRFRAMLLADTRPDADTEDARAGRVAMQQSVREKGAAAAADAMIPKLLGPQSLNAPASPAAASAPAAQVRDRTRELIVRNSAAGIIDALEALKTRADSTSTLALVTCPTLVIVGQDDSVTPVKVADAMVTGVSNSAPWAEQVTIPDAGHLSNLEQPERFNAALWQFAGRL